VGLEPSLQKITPPAKVWQGIEGRLDLGWSRRSTVRWLAIAASVLLAVFAFFTLRPVELVATQQASIEADPQTIYWHVELLGDNRELTVQALATHPLESGKAHELWILPAPGSGERSPVSLGLLPASGTQHLVLNAAQRAALAGAKQLAVSLEPAGGSPTGLPTGPVIHVAPLSPV
jgi:anti-sigma-K factor RskA